MDFNKILCLDTEVFSPGDLKTEGTYRNSERSECLIATYALPYNDSPVLEWDVTAGEPMPKELSECLADPSIEIAMHNAAYDRVQMEAWGWGDRFDLNPRRFLCTMTWAKMCKLPAGLSELCQVLNIPVEYAKKDGDALIRLFCGLKKLRGGGTERVMPSQEPEKWKRFLEYARNDISAMRECMKRMPNVFSEDERDFYALTEEMNDRGMLMDLDLAVSASTQAAEWKKRYKKQASEVAQDDGFNVVSQKAFLAYLSERGVRISNARGSTIAEFLDSSGASLLPESLITLLRTRLKASKAAVAKYATVIKATSSDSRLKGTIQFYGAGTGRDAGRKFQPQNLARPTLIGKGFSMEDAVSMVKGGTAELYVDDPMQLFSDTVRGLIIPSEGNKLCDADLASIEGRVLPWLAGEDWKVAYFRDLDAGRVKYDSYELAYALAFGVDPSTVTPAQRTLGKPIDLASGFGGGVSALISFAAIYRIDIDAMAAAASEAADPDLYASVLESYEWFEEKKLTVGLSKETWAGLYYIIKAWRAKNPATVAYWAKAEEAFRNAFHNQGTMFSAGRGVTACCHSNTVYVQLPSKRVLVYPKVKEIGDGKRKSLAYEGVNPITRKWSSIYTYGGRLVENYTQAVARDVLFHNLKKIEGAGYEIIMRIHDQILAEVPLDSNLSGEHLARLMSTPHPWCEDLPLAAEGVDLMRFQKL